MKINEADTCQRG